MTSTSHPSAAPSHAPSFLVVIRPSRRDDAVCPSHRINSDGSAWATQPKGDLCEIWRRPGFRAAPDLECFSSPYRPRYVLSLVRRVAQLPRAVRVPPQLPSGGVAHWPSVHDWAMYSDAIHKVLPSVTAAP